MWSFTMVLMQQSIQQRLAIRIRASDSAQQQARAHRSILPTTRSAIHRTLFRKITLVSRGKKTSLSGS